MSPRQKKERIKRKKAPPRRRAEVLRMPEAAEGESSLHPLFWLWLGLLVILIISLLIVGWR